MLYHLKLCKGRSYIGDISASREHPDVYVKDEAAALAAVASGFFKLIDGPSASAGSDTSADESARVEELPPNVEDLAGKSKAEIVAFAQEHGIDLKGCRTKDDMLDAIGNFCGADGVQTMLDLPN